MYPTELPGEVALCMIAGVVIAAVGVGLSAYAASEGSAAQRRQFDYQAKVAKNQAQAEIIAREMLQQDEGDYLHTGEWTDKIVEEL